MALTIEVYEKVQSAAWDIAKEQETEFSTPEKIRELADRIETAITRELVR